MIPQKFLKFFTLIFLSSFLFSIETTSDFRGKVTDNFGNSLQGANVTITNVGTNISSSTTTNETGNFIISNLSVGGPYTILITSSVGSQRYEDVFLNLGQTLALNVTLRDFEQLVVTGAQVSQAQVAIGPNTIFNEIDLETTPSIERDIKEVLLSDPRFTINPDNRRALSCNGSHPRLNGFTLDGVALTDGFGLNSNGYPTTRMPFSYDAVQQVAVEFAPFDVQYGNFQACAINAVTKSGTNEISGNAFYEYAGDELAGNKYGDNTFTPVPYEESKVGFTLGGPMIQDKAFFFLAVERYDQVDTSPYGPLGSGAPNEQDFISMSMYNEIIDIMKTKYNFDPGGIPTALDSYDNSLLIKFDVEIDENNSMSLGYTYNDGFYNSPSDTAPREFEFDKHFYERGYELHNINFKLESVFTDSLNGEFRFGWKQVNNRQLGKGGVFGDFQIEEVLNPDTGVEGEVYLGGTDDSRQNNDLNYTTITAGYIVDQLVGNHLITYGFEYQTTNIYNLYMPESINGEWDFKTIADLEAGITDQVHFRNTPSLVDSAGAADWDNGIATLYVQDEIQVRDDLEIVIGIRYDQFIVDAAPLPAENATFKSAYGYSNTITHDGAGALVARFGFNWDADENTTLYGGYGGFSGGNPNIWYSNMVQNDGTTIISVNTRDIDNVFTEPMCSSDTGLPSDLGPGYAVPCSLVQEVQSGTSNTDTNSTDPDYEQPIVHRVALGLTSSFGVEDLQFNVDFQYSEASKPAYIKNINISPNGNTDFLGVPYYNCASGNARDSFSCFGPYDFQLTNSDLTPLSRTFSTSVKKYWRDQDVSFSLAYAKIYSEDVSAMTSFVAFSNYGSPASNNWNNPPVARSDYAQPERVTASISYTPVTIEGGYRTKFSVYLRHFEAKPFSLIYDGEVHGKAPGFFDLNPIYVPTDANDPNVVFDGISPADFFAITDAAGCARGKICPRNAVDGPWTTVVDVKLAQEFPGFRPDHEAEIYMVIKNFMNLLDPQYGEFSISGWPRKQRVARLSEIDNLGRYVYDRLYSPSFAEVLSQQSTYQVKFGFYYRF